MLALASVMALRATGQFPSPKPPGGIPSSRRWRTRRSTTPTGFRTSCVFNGSNAVKKNRVKRWQVLDTQEREVGYISHQEHYRLLSVDGKAPGAAKIKPGYFLPSGEFGTALGYIFQPKAAAQFEWDHAEQGGAQQLCVFRYRVSASESTIVMYSDGEQTHLGHHGIIYADCKSAMPTRRHIESEPASVRRGIFKVALGWNIDVRYAMTQLARGSFCCHKTPSKSKRHVSHSAGR
jgi:hypothetical protein